MIRHVIVVLFLIAFKVDNVTSNAVDLQYKEEWNSWKQRHNIKYSAFSEELKRYLIWEENKKFIESHNSKNHSSFVLKMNQFGDLTLDEYSALYTCHLVSDTRSGNKEMYEPPKDAELPQTMDWRKKEVVTGIKNQGEYRCHSCYAFAAVGALESHYAIHNGTKIKLSEQNVIDCSANYGNYGCEGGNYRWAYNYIIANKGIDTQQYYRYKALKRSCKYSSAKIGATMTKVLHIETESETALKSAVALKGPVVVSIDHKQKSFQFYGGGIYSESDCYTNYYLLTHEMIVVGYGTYQNKDYWIIKNSYGSSWGNWGYMKMLRGQNNCGIASDAAFPIIS